MMGFLADNILSNNISAFAGNKRLIIPSVIVVEEAQNVLSSKAEREGKSVFIRAAKEGRKFGVSLIYITQQPGSIDESILSQTDNYFVMHLLNENDIRSLEKANFHYSGIIAKFLKSEALVGNVYIYSAPYQPYVFPARVFNFEELSSRIESEQNSTSLKRIVDECLDLLKGNTFKTTSDGRKYIKIGHLQYIWGSLDEILKAPCFEETSEGLRLKYRFAKVIVNRLFPHNGINGNIEKIENSECWIVPDDLISGLEMSV